MRRKLAIIHTTPATIEPLKALASELLPDSDIVNVVDDSILPQLASNGGDIGEIEERWTAYARFAEQGGADAILSACSSVGELVARAQPGLSVPLVRIDEAMAEEAMRRADRIGVAATLSTTLGPTLRLLQSKAEALGKQVHFESIVVDAAYRRLMDGDRDGHDRVLGQALADLVRKVDVVVLAQASMARVVATLPEADRDRFLSSPRLGMQRVKDVLEGSR